VKLQQFLDVLFPPQCGACDAPGSGACERCFPYGPYDKIALPTLDVSALAAYEGPVRRAVLALKAGRRDVARAFAQRLCSVLEGHEVLVPVPTTAARRRQRGFDGCEFIARCLAARLPVRVHAHLVQTAGDKQRGRGRGARLQARGRFAWRGPALDGTRVTLLDDVVTTGATLEDCARTLRLHGAIVQRAIVVARVAINRDSCESVRAEAQ